MARLLATVLLLGALLCCASAGRKSHWERVESALRAGHDEKALKWLQRGLRNRATGGLVGDKKEEEDAIIAIKYEVQPSMHDDFIDAWTKLQDKTIKEDGNLVYDLAKTMGDNVFFWTYGEWDSMEKYIDHIEAGHTQDFLDFLDDNDITWELFPLRNVGENADAKQAKREGMGLSLGKGKGKGKDDDPRDRVAHVVVQYHVPPSMVDDFVDAWTDAAKSTWDEEENRIYALRKVATMNHHYLAYGTWESFDAYWDHFTSKHMRNLREFLSDNDITWYIEPVVKFGEKTGE